MPRNTNGKRLKMASYKPTQGMKTEAQKGLDWRREHGRGGTAVGIARARDIVSGKNLSESTVKRMYSFFSRHEVDKQGEGFTPDEDGFPSNGRIAWALWGGDAGFRWSKAIVDRLKKEDDGRMASNMSDNVERHIKDIRETEDSYIVEFGKSMPEENDDERPYDHEDEEERAAPDALEVGDFVSWDTSGGRARGEIEQIERNGTIDVPDSDFSVEGTEDDPAALIRVYRGGEESDTLVGHKFSTLTKINPLRGEHDEEDRSKEVAEKDATREEEANEQRDQQESDNDEAIRFYAEENLQRAFHFDKSKIDEDNRTIMIGVSSEEPVERRFGMEVLGHNEEEIDMAFMSQGRSPLLLDHDHTKQIGVVEEFGIDKENKRTVAKVRFSKNKMADEVYRDVLDGIRQNISVGYQVNSMEKEEEERDGVPIYRVNSWSPLEVSAVSIPADQSRLVGFARSKEKKAQIEINPNSIEERKMENKVEETKTPEVNLDEMKRDFAKEAKAIIDLGVQHNKRDLANEAIANGATLAQFRGTLLETIANDKPLDLPSNVDLNEKEQRSYSLLKAVSEAAQGKLSGLEKEVSDEIASRTGKEARGFYMPTNINFRANQVVGTNNVGGFLKPTDHLGDEFIEALKARLVVGQAGARILQGLKGDVAIPKMSAETSNVSFVAEDSAPSEGNATFAQVTMSPKTLACQLDISRKLQLQSDPSIEAVLRQDVINSFARKIDEVALEGGGSNEPSGIIASSTGNVVAIGTNGGAISYANCVDMVEAVEVDNAILNDASVKFVGNPKVTANLRTISKQSSGVEGNFILGEDNRILGYDYMSSTLVPSDLSKGTGSNLSALIFGDFSQLLLGFYSGVDVIVDPYTGSNAGTLRLAFFQDFDVALRHDDSFSVIKDIVT
jgi:HK97 family phage major capsid protein